MQYWYHTTTGRNLLQGIRNIWGPKLERTADTSVMQPGDYGVIGILQGGRRSLYEMIYMYARWWVTISCNTID